MNQSSVYRVLVHGQLDESDLNASSPIATTVASVSNNTSELTVETDQSGVMGVLRHLHGLGFAIISVQSQPNNTPLEAE